ncbi:MAG: hypothetical protein JNK11_04140 [Alphaproteobacteria bacterium]|nr:hypothetical protein [Alphaproteobacteria bacterium]
MADTSASFPPTPLIPKAAMTAPGKPAAALRAPLSAETSCAGAKSECIVSPEPDASTFFSHGGPSFGDILDLINPLQHLPIVSSIYRSITGDKIGDGPRVIGGFLWGGPLGLFSATADLAVEKDSGRDMMGTLVAAVSGEPIGRKGSPVESGSATRAVAQSSDPMLARAATSSNAQIAQAGSQAPWIDESRLAAAIEQARLNQTDLDAAMLDARSFGPPVWREPAQPRSVGVERSVGGRAATTPEPSVKPIKDAEESRAPQQPVARGAAVDAASASTLPPGAIARRAPNPSGSNYVSAPFHFDSRLNGSSPSARRAASPYATPSAGPATPPPAAARAGGGLLAPDTARAMMAAPAAAARPTAGSSAGPTAGSQGAAPRVLPGLPAGAPPTGTPGASVSGTGASGGPAPAFLDAMRAGLDKYGRAAKASRGAAPAPE